MSRRKTHVVPIVLLALGAIVVSGSSLAPSEVRQAQPTPLELFQKLLPVVRHNRCINCHGDVDPRSSNHEGQDSVLAGRPCKDCHKAVSDWHLPVPEHFFVGKSDKELCGLFADFASFQGHAFFISNHLEGDELIGAAFKGRLGGALDTSESDAAKPPMTRGAWVNLAKDWLNQGQGACEVLGTITQKETEDTVEVWSEGPIDYKTEHNGSRTVTVSLRGGQFHANIAMDDTLKLTIVVHGENAAGRPCTVTSVGTTRYLTHTSGAARVNITLLAHRLFGDTRPPQKDYRIDVTLPPETTEKTETNSTANLCGGPIASGTTTEPPQRLDWPAHTFTIEGHLDDPQSQSLSGACDKIVRSGEVGTELARMFCFIFPQVGNSHYPGLLDHGGGGSNHLGGDIPFRVQTFWNVAYRP